MCRLPRRESEGTHVGRGGAANIVRVPTREPEEAEAERRARESEREKEVRGKGKGKANEDVVDEQPTFAERGRRWVAGLVGKGGL